MIRSRFRALAVLLLILGIASMVVGFNQPVGSPVAPPLAEMLKALPQQFDVDVSDMAVHLRGRPKKDVEDQLRDWAVYGTLARLGADKDELGKATYKVAPVRLPYLEQAFAFEYGRGRRVLIGDRQVLLFHDADDPEPAATLGRLADKVRMETGEIPPLFSVFSVATDLGTNKLHVSRKADVDGAAMFGPAFGYSESTVSNQADLDAWMARIDDVTYAAEANGGLRLGGRRFEKARTLNVTVEDVAALVQAQNALQLNRAWREGPTDPGFSLDPQWNPNGLAATLSALADNPCAAVRDALAIFKSGEPPELDAAPALWWQSVNLLMSSFASPEARKWCATLREQHGAELRRMAADVRSAAALPDAKRRSEALESAMLPLFRMQRAIRTSATRSPADEAFSDILEHTRMRHQVQCARYDGPLEGTRVGMNLFYTDLLAKLWQAVDFHHASPVVQVAGFLTKPRVQLETRWEEEIARLPSTRLWFGPRSGSYARSKGGDALWFEHIATRVFAAGSDPASPGKESQPNEMSRRTLGWWDRHYAAVADFEQQYHLQNQIEKWSLITGQWRDRLQFLGSVRVDHSLRFDRWYEQEKPRLQYKYPIQLRPEKDWVTGTECLDLLQSYPFQGFEGSKSISSITGGVSLGGRAAIASAPKIVADAPWSMRQLAQEAAHGGEGVVKTARPAPAYKGAGEALVTLGETAPTRMGAKDLGLGEVRVRSNSFGAGEMKLAVTSDKGSIGAVTAHKEGGGVRLGWRSGEVHAGAVDAEKAIPAPSLGTPVKGAAFEAVRDGEYGKFLDRIAEAGDDPAQVKQTISELRSAAVSDGEARFAKGPTASADLSYEAAVRLAADLSPRGKMELALSEIERGQAARGLDTLAMAGLLNEPALLDASRGKPGLEELNRLVGAKSTGAASLGGKGARDATLLAEGAEIRSVLKVDRLADRVFLDKAKRASLLEKDGRRVTVYIAGFDISAVEFEASAPGTLAQMEKMPHVEWSAVDAADDVFRPSVLVEGDVRYERATSPRTAAAASPQLTTPRVVFLRNCDANNDGALSAAERSACPGL